MACSWGESGISVSGGDVEKPLSNFLLCAQGRLHGRDARHQREAGLSVLLLLSADQ